MTYWIKGFARSPADGLGERTIGTSEDAGRPGGDRQALVERRPDVPRRFAAAWRSPVAREMVIAVAAFVAYFAVRGLTEGLVERAQENARLIIRIEKWLGIYIEGSLQVSILDNDRFVTAMNWVYIWGHWPVIAIVAIWLVHTQYDHYILTRNAFLISGAIGLVIFALLPVAPPRLVGDGFIDTVTERSISYRALQPPLFTNQYAAMPSLHLGWDLLMGIALVRYATWLPLRVFGVLLPLFMGAAIILTANHFILDGIAGVSLAIFGLWAAARFRSRSAPEEKVEPHLSAPPGKGHSREAR